MPDVRVTLTPSLAQTRKQYESGVTPEPNTGCWLWDAMDNGRGYGVLLVDGKRTYAHRYSYAFFKGPIPEGMFVLHACDTPQCSNPEHLFLGTHEDNMRDMKEKGRCGHKINSMPGEANPQSKLTTEQVLDIRARHAAEGR